MNSSKRRRHSLYFWVDVFFLIFPLVLIVGYLAFLFVSYSLASKELFSNVYNLTENFDSIFDFLYRFATEGFFASTQSDDGFILYSIDSVCNYCFGWLGTSSFSNYVLSFLYSIFDFFGLKVMTDFGYFNFYGLIINYFAYIICYEFLSFFIQIVLWIPRYFKNKLYDRGLME